MNICLACNSRFNNTDWDCPNCGKSPEERDGFLAFAPELAHASEGFESTFFETLTSLESGNFWFESRNRLLIWALRRYFPAAHSQSRFLEIGCGTGFVAAGVHAAFPELSIVGSEIFSQGLSFAQKRLPTATLLQMDARKIPFADEFDIIGIFDVLEHIAEDEIVLGQIFQALKPGAGVIVTVPQHRFLWSIVDEYGHHYRRYARSELMGKVRRAGFEIVRVTSFMSLLLPLILLSRITTRGTAENYDPRSEFRMSSRVNALLTDVMNVERALIQRGISFPLGSSLLLVARRPLS